jgi:hypothetical protein
MQGMRLKRDRDTSARRFCERALVILVLAAVPAAASCYVKFKRSARRLDAVLVKVVGKGVAVVKIQDDPDTEARWLADLKKSVSPEILSRELLKGIMEAGGKPWLPFDFTASYGADPSGMLRLHVERYGFSRPRKGPAELFYTVWARLADKTGRQIYKRRIDCVSTGEISNVPAALQGLSYWCGVRVVKKMREDWNK